MRPADLPAPASYPHGTRSRYVTGCRCAECRASNTRAYHLRQARAKAAAAELVHQVPAPAPQLWTAPDGTKRVRTYARACPGVHGKPCPNHSHLRKDSKGGICGRCRELLLWNGLVDAARARQHLVELAGAGVGRRAVEAACDVPHSILQGIKTGRKTRIRAQTERRILAVDAGAIADGARVSGKEAFALIRELLAAGLSKAEIARRLGCSTPALQLRRRAMRASSVLRVERLHREVMAEVSLEERLSGTCRRCGYSHEEDRQLFVARMLDARVATAELAEEWSCLYPGPAGVARCERDRQVLRGRAAA